MTDSAPAMLRVRRPELTFEPTTWTWTPAAPEISAVADAISLAMPSIEPYVVRSVRAVQGRLPEPLHSDARTYAAQESAHHALHRRYNDSLRSIGRGVAPIEHMTEAICRRLERCSEHFNVAFAAGFEAVAFAAARWVDPRVDRLFADAEPQPSSLFLWHLAEEAEHKGVAHSVMRAIGVKRRTYLVALIIALTVLATVTFAGTIVFLAHQRRLWNPWSWFRIIVWTFSYLFVALPMCAMSMSRSYHPDQLSDPTSLRWWLLRFDDSTRTFPAWDSVG